MNNGLDRDTLSRLVTVFNKFPSLEKVTLFGSRAKGVHKKGSDIDIAVKGLSDSGVVSLSMCLNEETDIPFFFDVIDVDSISSSDLISHIQRVGITIFER